MTDQFYQEQAFSPAALRDQDISPPKRLSWAVQAGDLCPACQQARLDFDGCLNLVCPVCGFFAGGGGFT
jgi:hypothetical protein